MSDRLFELDDIAQTLRVTPLSELASQVSETEDNYLSLRAQGLSDLAIVDKYVDFPRDNWDLEAMYEVYNDDDLVAREIARDAGLDFGALKREQGVSAGDVIKFFVEGRDITPGEGVLEGLGRGTITGGSAVPGAIGGAAAGAATPLPGGMILGSILGGLFTGTGGALAEDALFDDRPILDPDSRAAMEAAKTGTEGIFFLSIPGALGRLGSFAQKGIGPKILLDGLKKSADSGFVEAIRTNPRAFYIGEALGITGATGAAYAFEKTAPTSDFQRMAGEVAAGLFGQQLVYWPNITRFLNPKNLLGRFSEAQQTERLGFSLTELMKLNNEDPEAVLKALRDAPTDELNTAYREMARLYQMDPQVQVRLFSDADGDLDLTRFALPVDETGRVLPLAAPTVGQITESNVLKFLERSILDKGIGQAGGGRARQVAQRNMDSIAKLLAIMTMSGNPEAVREAARIRQAIFTDMVAQRMNVARIAADRSIAKLDINEVDTGSEASSTVYKLVDNAYNDIRFQEDKLYDDINGDFVVPADNLIEALDIEIKKFPSLMLNKKEYFPPDAEFYLNKLSGGNYEDVAGFIQDLERSGFDTTLTGAVARNLGRDAGTLRLINKETLPVAIYEKLSPNVQKRLNKSQELADEQGQLEMFVLRNEPPEGVDGRVLSPTAQEYRQHFETLAERFPEEFSSGYDALKQYENAVKRLRAIPNDILDNAVLAGDVLPVARSIPPPEPLTMDDMRKMRSIFLDLANRSMAGEAPTRNMARIYGDFANAILEDLGDTDGIVRAAMRPREGMLGANEALNELEKLDKARAFSRAKNDAFLRSFPNIVLRDKATGADFVLPELLRHKILTGGGDATKLRLDELRNAVGFLAKQNIVDVTEEQAEKIAMDVSTLTEAEDTILRLLADKSINPITGEVDVNALVAEFQRNRPALSLFPDLQADFENAARAQYRLRELNQANLTGDVQQALNDFTMNFMGEDVSGAFLNALKGKNPTKAVVGLVRRLQEAVPKYEARIGGRPGQALRRSRRGDFSVEDINKALKAVVFDAANINAGATSKDGINFQLYKDFFFSPQPGKNPSLARILVQSGVMEQEEVSRLNKLLTRAAQVQRELGATDGPDVLPELMAGEDLISDLVFRLTGAKAGTTLSRVIPGAEGSLIPGQAGSTFVRKILGGIPVTTLRKVINEATRDPELMAMLLEKGLNAKTLQQQAKFVRGFSAAMKSAFGTYVSDAIAESISQDPAGQVPPPGTEKSPVPTAANLRQFREPPAQPAQAPPPPPVAAAPMPMPPMPAPPPMALGPQQQMQRQRFAQAYPFDPVSDIIRTQGIGGLI